MEPSEPPDVSSGWIGCHAIALMLSISFFRQKSERRTANFFLVSLEDTELLHGPDIKDAHSLVSRRARQKVAIGRPGDSLDGVFMRMSELFQHM